MKVSDLRFYGQPFTDAEGSWPDDVRRRMKRRSQKVVIRRLGLWRMPSFFWKFRRAHKRMRSLDLTPFRERGLTNQRFIDTQLEYLAFFIAVQELVGREEAVSISREVMQESAYEPMLLCLPEQEDVRAIGEPFDVMAEYLRAMPDAGLRGGSHEMDVHEDSSAAFQFNVRWCVWLELARAAGVPQACIANCHADDLVFPDYFDALGIKYRRTQTLACGGTCCDFRFERNPDSKRVSERPQEHDAGQ
jgi:hypothetical protein